MKKQWLVILGLLCFLWGCQAPVEPNSVPATEPEGTVAATSPTVPSGFSMSEIRWNTASDGAVRFCSIPIEAPAGIRFLGENLLLFSGADDTTLTLFSRENLQILAQQSLGCTVSQEDPAVTVSTAGFTYYDPAAGEWILLDTYLREISKTPVPGHPSGAAAGDSQIYYFGEDGLQIWNPDTHTVRLLREMNLPGQALTGIHSSNQILECSFTDESGEMRTLFLSAENGSLVQKVAEPIFLKTDGDFYAAIRYDGTFPELLSGSSHFGPSVLVTDRIPLQFLLLPDRRGVVTVTETTATVLDYYDLETGSHPYQLELPDSFQLIGLAEDPYENALWFLSVSSETQDSFLCRWDLEQSSTEDRGIYLQPPSSPESPDSEGLALCSKRAAELEEKYGIRILVWTDATADCPYACTLIPEHQIPVISDALNRLDAALSEYPADIFRKIAPKKADRLTIRLVRSIEDFPAVDPPDNRDGFSHYDKDGNPCLTLAINSQMEQTVFREIYYFMESRILCTDPALDSWNALNPPDFSYDYEYHSYLSRDTDHLLSGAERAFADSFAMTFPREDRARMMEYAMIPGQKECFSGPIMQRKLQILCQSIREAFSLPDDEIYLWEQYLSESAQK